MVPAEKFTAVAYDKVGDALAAEGNLTEASQILQDSLTIRERLATINSSDTDSRCDLAISQGNVAAVLAEQGDTSRALELVTTVSRHYRAARGAITR